MLELDAAATALVLIDLQKGIAGSPGLAPRSGADVVEAAGKLAGRFRAAGGPVVLVNVAYAQDGGDVLRQPVDRANPRPAALPAGWTEIVDGLAQPGDLRVTKHNWGAFFGTDLDVQLRRRKIRTVVVGGIATNMGVESTVRQAHEHGYEIVVAEDLCSSRDADMHNFSVERIFPLISRVRRSDEIDLR